MPRKRVSLNIKNPAVQAALEREERNRRPENEIRRMEETARRISALPVLDPRSDEEILGYGPEGYPVGN